MLDITPRLYNLTSRDNKRAVKNDWTNFLD